MYTPIKFALSAVTIAVLSGCLEVEDKNNYNNNNNNNEDILRAIEEQTLLSESNQAPITLFGSIIDAGSGNIITDALVKVGRIYKLLFSI